MTRLDSHGPLDSAVGIVSIRRTDIGRSAFLAMDETVHCIVLHALDIIFSNRADTWMDIGSD